MRKIGEADNEWRALMLGFHHVGVQTDDLDNCLNWYLDYFEADFSWQLDRFSDLTLDRLPGIVKLIEVKAGDVRFHLFDRSAHNRRRPPAAGFQFQHVCLTVDAADELPELRRRWFELYESGKYVFARPDPPSGIVTDADGTRSLYVLDVNGLEFEFTYIPGSARD
ncbi:Glyoxalase/Bleomycin resistance protein/Dioxygenase superfamily protein [Nonomuraea solani]|uniref:Glyoxalase/Bleomycin resistance protein/Dioxygenase superfamily protein n=2 Tax=Nonomuraea solani TaxID=1144553 RepID=A0A1H6EFQ2_9ACTN|nr:Glyoxalase/Bleomycin resistance protein/Dioxygenase superfamily protein [Nonomuraea solani]